MKLAVFGLDACFRSTRAPPAKTGKGAPNHWGALKRTDVARQSPVLVGDNSAQVPNGSEGEKRQTERDAVAAAVAPRCSQTSQRPRFGDCAAAGQDVTARA